VQAQYAMSVAVPQDRFETELPAEQRETTMVKATSRFSHSCFFRSLVADAFVLHRLTVALDALRSYVGLLWLLHQPGSSHSAILNVVFVAP